MAPMITAVEFIFNLKSIDLSILMLCVSLLFDELHPYHLIHFRDLDNSLSLVLLNKHYRSIVNTLVIKNIKPISIFQATKVELLFENFKLYLSSITNESLEIKGN